MAPQEEFVEAEEKAEMAPQEEQAEEQAPQEEQAEMAPQEMGEQTRCEYGDADSAAADAATRTNLETFEQEALWLEQQELQEVILKSNADARNADGVILVR